MTITSSHHRGLTKPFYLFSNKTCLWANSIWISVIASSKSISASDQTGLPKKVSNLNLLTSETDFDWTWLGVQESYDNLLQIVGKWYAMIVFYIPFAFKFHGDLVHTIHPFYINYMFGFVSFINYAVIVLAQVQPTLAAPAWPSNFPIVPSRVRALLSLITVFDA